MNDDHDPAHEADMRELRREQLEADFDPVRDAEEVHEMDYSDLPDDDSDDDFQEENDWPVNRSYERV
jgi:hypothetical protein